MRVDLYPELIEVLRSARSILSKRDFFLWKRDGEPRPEEIGFSFTPIVAEKLIASILDKNACTLCARRISYKKEQFAKREPREPYLFLVHNDFLGPKAGFYNKAQENTLFLKMIESVLGFSAKDALVRELVRCHFSKEDLKDESVVQNCSVHLRRDLEDSKIRGILLFGQAASLVFRTKESLALHENRVFTWNNLPTMVCPGPNRLVFMREKGYSKEQIDAERRKIFDVLEYFKKEVILVKGAI